MRKITLITLMLFTALSYAQVGINTNTPDASSALEIESTTGGILIPRMTETQRDAIVSPASGLMIYQTDQDFGFYFYNGTGWTKIDGVAGPQGDQGVQGIQGPAGPQGDQGVQGATGAQGPAGPQGEQGIQGAAGQNGSDGSSAYQIWVDAGNTGTESDFLASLVGADGQDGSAGQDGAAGQNGSDGSSAYQIWVDAGNTGTESDFLASLVGADGQDGSAGQDGAAGQNGSDGSSAYQIWVDAGNTGTESDFLASLVGPQGDQGIQGPQGEQGIQGETGLSGSASPAGSIIRLLIQNGSTNFTNSDLYSADLSGFNLSGLNFSGAIFTGVSSGNVSGNPVLPSGYSIVNGYIVGPGVDLSNADLTNQDLTGVDLSGADLSGTDLGGANMTNATIPREFANIKKIEIKKSIGGHQTIRAMHFIVESDSGEFDAARPSYAIASTTNVNHQSPNFSGTRDIIHMIGDNKTNTNNYTYNGGDTGTILFNTPHNISKFKEMTIYGWAQFGGGYYSRIADTQYILYTENNVKIYDFTTPSEHSNGDQKAIYRIAGPAGISDGSIWTADADGHFANANYSGGHYALDIVISPLVTVEN